MSANDPLTQPAADGAIHVRPAEITADLVSGPRRDYAEEGIRPDLPAEVRTPKPHPGFWWSLLWCVGFLIVTQFPGAVVAVVFMFVLSRVRPDLISMHDLLDMKTLMGSPGFSFVMAVAFGITEVLVVGVSWLVIRLVVGRSWKRQLALRRPGLAHVALVLVGFPALPLLGDWVYMVLREFLKVPSLANFGIGDMEQMVQLFARWPVALGVLLIGLGPGIGEELWCRGFLGRGLVGRYGPFIGVALTSFFFGFIHLDPRQGLMAMFMGLWLHFVYLTTRSLWLPMLLHFLNNSLSVVAEHYGAFKNLDDNGVMPPYLVAASALLMAGVGWALYRSRARLMPEKDGAGLWQPPYPGVMYPPPGSGTRVAHPRPSWDALAAAAVGTLVFAAACVMASL